MFRNFIKNKKAQNTAEYALLIALVVAGVIAMQTYAQRALQGRIRDASQFMVSNTSTLGNTVQYEPYYSQSAANIIRSNDDVQILTNARVSQNVLENRTRQQNAYTATSYNALTGVQSNL